MKKHFTWVCLLAFFVLLLGGCAEPYTDNEASLTNNDKATVTTVPSSTHKESSSTSTTSTPATTATETTTTAKPVPTTTVSSKLTTTTAAKTTATTTSTVSSTTFSSKTELPTTTTTTGRSRYTSSTKLKPEDFHTDILMHLDKSVYTTEDTVQMEIENKTGGEISFGYRYYVLKQQKNDEWTKIYHGQGTIALLHTMKGDGTFKTSVKLAPYELAANEQYKLALEIEGKWVAADFETIAAPKTNAVSTTTRSPELTTATTTSRRANPTN